MEEQKPRTETMTDERDVADGEEHQEVDDRCLGGGQQQDTSGKSDQDRMAFIKSTHGSKANGKA